MACEAFGLTKLCFLSDCVDMTMVLGGGHEVFMDDVRLM